MPDANVNLIWIPLFPLLGAVFNLLLGGMIMRWVGERIGKEIVHLVAIGAVAFSCFFTFSVAFQPGLTGLGFMSYLQFQQLPPGTAEELTQNVYNWMVSGETTIRFELLFDRLSAIMCMVVTGVGLLIHIFSVGYMSKDKGYHRYFGYLNLFMAAMLILVLGKSLVVLFVGWEGVGLCSYLLIGFWFTDDAKATAGRKAFIMNRIGDFGFVLGMLLIYSVTNSLDFDAIRSYCTEGANSPFVTTTIFGASIATVATLCLFVGCTGKSAQIPLFTWLPDAMAGPTPVSALIHAATMVTAGVYLCVRMNFLFALAPTTMAIIAIIGAVTALFAATIGITQNDIKKVLAYSTVSQLGYMFLAVGMGAWVAAIFHSGHARVLQGLPLPRFGLGHRGVPPQPGHPDDGRAEKEDARHRDHLRDKLPSHRGDPPAIRLLFEGRDPAARVHGRERVDAGAQLRGLHAWGWPPRCAPRSIWGGCTS